MNKMKRLTALLLVLMMLFGTLAASAESYSAGSMTTDQWNQLVDDAQHELFSIHEGGSGSTITPPAEQLPSNPSAPYQNSNGYYLTQGNVSMSTSDIVTLTSGVAGQWQIQVGTLWVNLAGQTSNTLSVTYAMLANTNSVNYAVRQVDADGGVIGTVTFDVTEAVPAERPQVLSLTTETRDADDGIMTLEGANNTDDVKTTYNIVVNYKYQDASKGDAGQSYTATLAAGTSFNATVAPPTVVGYKVVEPGNLPEGVTYNEKGELVFNLTNVSAGIQIDVIYEPDEVNYTVKHYWQNINDDGYAEPTGENIETKTGLTESTVPDVHKTEDGFYNLLYERPAIAADGSTEIEVYYDRYYYLMNFDMDGGYGTEPVYARYGAPIGTVTEPTRAGYKFLGWSETKNGNIVEELPETMPAESKTYYAIWEEADTTFIVEYYLQNPDDVSEYEYIAASDPIPAKTGDVVDGNAYKELPEKVLIDEYTKKYAIYKTADENVTVAADGTTIVKVYYNRKVFTLRFYYAMSEKSGNATNYYVVGGSTYYFGKKNCQLTNDDDRSDELKLLDQYMTRREPKQQRGQTSALPVLKEEIQTKYKSYQGNNFTIANASYNYHTFYYFQFDAAYGASLTNLWPVDVFESVTMNSGNNSSNWSEQMQATMSAWNGEYNVHYSQHNTNETIKGKYSVLDYQILWENNEPSDNVVSYLCFWENGAKLTWNVPELFVYNIWVPVIEDESVDGETKVYENVKYYLRESYNTVDNDSGGDDKTEAAQTQPAIEGFDAFKKQMRDIDNPDESKYKCAHWMDFYYKRKSYTITFNSDGVEIAQKTIPFEMGLKTFMVTPELDTGKHEKDSLEFAGWYTSPNFSEETKVDFDTATMPANNMVVYAKWVPVTHTVKFYLTENSKEVYTPNQVEGEANAPTGASFTVSHGGNIAEEYVKAHLEKSAMIAAKPNGSYEFVMWYYYENGEKKPFDPTTQIRKDLTLYGEWSSNVLKQYRIYYKIQDKETEIAEPTNGSGLAGTSKTFDAKGDKELYDKYQDGYFPVVQSHTMLLDIANKVDEANGEETIIEKNSNDEEVTILTYTFWYKPVNAVPYTVRYVTEETVAEGTNTFGTVTVDGKTYTKLAQDEEHKDNRKAVVTENFVPISGYMPDAYQKRLVVTAEGENILYFYYSKDETHAYYKITHHTQNTDGEGWTEYASSQAVGDIGTRYTASPMTIPGFTYDHIEYVVNEKNVTDVTNEGAKLTADGLEINLYYVRNEYPYQVRYLELGSGTQLHDPKNGAGKYGQVIPESAIDIDGYELVGDNSQTLNIRIDEGEGAPKLNIITFYYKEKEVTINYVAVGPEGAIDFGSVDPTTETVKVKSDTAQGSTPTAGDGFKFVGWFKDEACNEAVDTSWVTDNKIVPQKTDEKNVAATYYAKFEYDVSTLTITKKGMKDGDSAIFKVKVGETIYTVVLNNTQVSVTLAGLKVGATYTIEEDGNWSNRYTVTKPENATGTITEPKNPVTVTFTNNKTNDQWLHDESGVINNFGDGTKKDIK